MRQPKTRRPRRRMLVAVALGATLVTSGCGLGTAGGFSPSGKLAGPVANVPSLQGATIAVGSKNFTEQILLGKMLVILLQSAGADVKDLTNIPGSASARQAMEEGQIDTAFEYTGTGWISYLGETTPIPDEQKQYEAVRDADLKQNHLIWTKPARANNTYGMAVKADVAKRLGITKLSQMKDVPAAERSFCVDSEFAARDDGFQPMLKAYGLTYGQAVPADQIRTLNEGAIYSATAGGDCTFGEVFTTDGRIKALGLTVLQDDKSFFPKYNAAVVVREQTLNEHPQLRPLFEQLSAKLDNETLMRLNGRIDVDGDEPTDVAYDFLQEAGLITR